MDLSSLSLRDAVDHRKSSPNMPVLLRSHLPLATHICHLDAHSGSCSELLLPEQANGERKSQH